MGENIDYLYERIEELDKRLQRAEKWIKPYNWLIFIEICIFFVITIVMLYILGS